MKKLNTMIKCLACDATLPEGAPARGLVRDGEQIVICEACWAKVERGGRTPRQVIEGLLLRDDPEAGGPNDERDHEDFRDLDLLGLDYQ